MTPTALLDRLHVDGVTLWLNGATLRYRGPSDVLTDDIHELIKTHKADLIAYLTPDPQPPAIPAYVKRCDHCGATDWGPVAGHAVWGCLTCHSDKAL